MILKKKELTNIDGGGIRRLISVVGIAITLFIAGIIDGYTRPYKCR